MPGPSLLSSPASGEPVSQVWRHVAKLVQQVERQSTQIADLQARLKLVRPMSGGNWFFRGAFVSETAYNPPDVVVVTPANEAVEDGAVPGLWLCLQPVSIELPVWPLPVPDDPASASNFWWPLSFYPRELKFKDYENDCAEMTMLVHSTEPEAV